MRAATAALLATFTFFTAAPAAMADEAAFLQGIAGQWKGSGSVKLNIDGNPTNVNCRLNNQASGNSVSVRGSCTALAIFSRDIGVDLRFDPGSGTYTGTYTGSKIGPAAVSGKRNGNRLDLVVTWPKPVNGDTTARMSIQTDGAGRLSFQVADQANGTGPWVQTTAVNLSKS